MDFLNSKEKPTSDEMKQMNSRMASLIEFLELNNISPAEAVPMSMRFIACTCKGLIDKKTLVAMFEMMVGDVYKVTRKGK